MKLTDAMLESLKRVRAENEFPKDFDFWGGKHELYLRLDENTVYAVHTSGIVTEHKTGI